MLDLGHAAVSRFGTLQLWEMTAAVAVVVVLVVFVELPWPHFQLAHIPTGTDACNGANRTDERLQQIAVSVASSCHPLYSLSQQHREGADGPMRRWELLQRRVRVLPHSAGPDLGTLGRLGTLGTRSRITGGEVGQTT